MELFRALAVLAEAPTPETVRLAALLDIPTSPSPADYTELFALELVPYASVYLGAEGMLGGEARDRIAGFWRALGETPPVEPDHLALLLAAYARLAELAAGAPAGSRRHALMRARGTLLWEHLLSWVPVYLDKLVAIAAPPYARWGRLLSGALESEARRSPATGPLPLHLRSAPPAAELDTSLEDLVAGVLTPVRAGVVLTRSDLRRAGDELGLGVRAGERRFVLASLLRQDARAVLGWLGRAAAAAAICHDARTGWLGDVAAFWAERARGTAARLDRAAELARR